MTYNGQTLNVLSYIETVLQSENNNNQANANSNANENVDNNNINNVANPTDTTQNN